MKLLLTKTQESKGMIKKSISYTLVARASLSEAESANIEKYQMNDVLLYTNLENRGSGLLGAISRATKGIEIHVKDLVLGRSIECKSIHEVIGVEEQLKLACKEFKAVLDTCSGFGGEQVIEF